MEDENFKNLSDEEKLSTYDSEIKKLSAEIDYEELHGIFYSAGEREAAVRRIERKIENLRSERASLLDRINIGLSKYPHQNKSKQVFIAVWFDSSMNGTIGAIEEGIKNAGLEPKCIKDEHFSERIMDKALGEIRKSRYVVVDLTGRRASVFFEAGFAYGCEIQSIYVYKKGSDKSDKSLEFYVKHFKCYEYESDEDLKDKIKDILLARIKQ